LGLDTSGMPIPPRYVDGLVDVLHDSTANFYVPLDLERLCRWQAVLFPTGYSGLAKIITGDLRGAEPMQVVSGPFGKEHVHFQAPPLEGLKKQVLAFIDWFNHPPAGLDGFIRAGIAHLWFLTLHPFTDGNGRIARAITDMALAQDEKNSLRLFRLSPQIMKNRKSYYEILEHTQRQGLDITDWLLWFIEQIFESCLASQKIMDGAIIKTKFWIQNQNRNINERQKKVLNCLLDNLYTHEEEMGINTRKYSSLTKTSRATAYRELDELVTLNVIKPLGKGRAARYVLNIDKSI
jgi:Fic family protein